MVKLKSFPVGFFVLLLEIFIQASQSTTADVVRLRHRVERDLDIYATCDMTCISEEELKDYDLLLEYEYEEEKHNPFFHYRSQPTPKTCVRACKFADPNQNVDFEDLFLDNNTVTPVLKFANDSKTNKENLVLKSAENIHGKMLSLMNNTTPDRSSEETEGERVTTMAIDNCNVTKSINICNCSGSTTTSLEPSETTTNSAESFEEDQIDEQNITETTPKIENVFKNIGIDSALLNKLLEFINKNKLTTENHDVIQTTNKSNLPSELPDVLHEINQTTTEKQHAKFETPVASLTDEVSGVSKEPTQTSVSIQSIPLKGIKFDFKYSVSKHENITFFASNLNHTDNGTDSVQNGLHSSSKPVQIGISYSPFETTLPSKSTTNSYQSVSSSEVPQLSSSSDAMQLETSGKDKKESTLTVSPSEEITTEIKKYLGSESKSSTADLRIKTSTTLFVPKTTFSSTFSTSTPQTSSPSTVDEFSSQSSTLASSSKSLNTMFSESPNVDKYLVLTTPDSKINTLYEGSSNSTDTTFSTVTSFEEQSISTTLDTDIKTSSRDSSVDTTINSFDLNDTKVPVSETSLELSTMYSVSESTETIEETTRLEKFMNISSTAETSSSVRDGKNKSSHEETTEGSSSKKSLSDHLSWLKDPSLPNLSDLALHGKPNFSDFPTLRINESKSKNSSDITLFQKNTTTEKSTYVFTKSTTLRHNTTQSK